MIKKKFSTTFTQQCFLFISKRRKVLTSYDPCTKLADRKGFDLMDRKRFFFYIRFDFIVKSIFCVTKCWWLQYFLWFMDVLKLSESDRDLIATEWAWFYIEVWICLMSSTAVYINIPICNYTRMKFSYYHVLAKT